MSGLDVLTPRGQVSISDEQAAARIFTERFPSYVYLETPKGKPADVDAILTVDGEMRQVIETKCRYDFDLDTFMGRYDGQWLVTHDKVVRAMAVAKSLQIGLTGFLYIVKSKTLLVQPLVDASGLFLTTMKVETTATQATINGGRAVRTNAYIDMRKAKRFA